jgi:hypothetical protein
MIKQSITRMTTALLAMGAMAGVFSGCDVPPATKDEAPSTVGGDDLAQQIEAAEKAGVAKPQRLKSDVTLKDGEDAVATAVTSAGNYVRKNGEWTRTDPETSFVWGGSCGGLNQPACTFTSYITDIKLVAGSTSGVACPVGYNKINVDLNRRAGGRWIFLCYLYGPASAAIDASSIKTTTRTAAHPEQYLIKGVNGSNGDMNQGAGGYYIYGTWAGTNTCRLTGVGVVTDSLGKVHPPLPFLSPKDPSYDVDLNDGAGGDFIYLAVLPETGCSWR